MMHLDFKLLFLLHILNTISVCRTEHRHEHAEVRSNFRNFCIDIQNVFRLVFGAPPLEWDGTLHERGQAWANYLSNVQDELHADDSKYGDNVFSSNNPENIDQMCKYAMINWTSQLAYYNYSKPEYNKGAAHFTQMVWYGTEKVGIGESGQADGKYYLVASYFPPGNIAGEFKDNVFEPRNVSLSCARAVTTKRIYKMLQDVGVFSTWWFYNSSKPCKVPTRESKGASNNTTGSTMDTKESRTQVASGTTMDTQNDWKQGTKQSTSGSTGTMVDTKESGTQVASGTTRTTMDTQNGWKQGTKESTSGPTRNTIGTQGGGTQETSGTKGDTPGSTRTTTDSQEATQGPIVVTLKGETSSVETPTKIMLVPVPEPTAQTAAPVYPAQLAKRALCVIPVLCALKTLPATPTNSASSGTPAKSGTAATPGTPAIAGAPATLGTTTTSAYSRIPATSTEPGKPATPLQENMNPPEATHG